MTKEKEYRSSGMSLYKIECVICPWCEKQSGHQIDHLYSMNMPVSWGPWYCNECNLPFRGTVNAPGNVTVERIENLKIQIRSMVLLKFDGKEGSVYFVIDHKRYSQPEDHNEDNRDYHQYFFEEHSCPTNWLRECVAVISGGDCDPHGVFEFVRSMDVTKDFNADDDCQWPLLFPEVFSDPEKSDEKMRM